VIPACRQAGGWGILTSPLRAPGKTFRFSQPFLSKWNLPVSPFSCSLPSHGHTK